MKTVKATYVRMGLCLSVLFLSLCFLAFAADPGALILQGMVKTADGASVSGKYPYRIKFWDASAGGTQIGGDIQGVANLMPTGRYTLSLIPPADVLLKTDVWYSLYLDINKNGINEDDLLVGRVKVFTVLYGSGENGNGKPIVFAPPPGQGHTHDASAIVSGEIPDEFISDLISISSDGFIEAEAIKSGTIDDARLSVNVTLQGNTFNGPNQLVQLDPSGKLPPGIGAIPNGGIIAWSGNIASIPKDWVLCDGTNGTPDLRDRFIVGAAQDDSGVAKTNIKGSLMITGGEQQHQLTISEMPSHSHSSLQKANRCGDCDAHEYDKFKCDDGGATVSAGGDQPHENCPPFYALAFIMKL